MFNPFDQFDKSQGQQPLVINGPPRMPSPQTSAQAATDQNQAAASALDPAMKAAQLEHTRLENEAARRKATEGILDPGALDRAARQYIMTGQMSSYGMGGAAQKVAIQNRADQIANVQGLTAEQQQVGYARYRNQAAALAQQEKALGGLRDNEAGAMANVQQYIDRSQELPLQTGQPWLNSIIQAGQRHLNLPGHDVLGAMDTAMTNAGGEVGKVVAGTPQGGGVLSDSQFHHSLQLLQGPATMDTKLAIARQLQKDMDNRVNGYQRMIEQGYANLGKPGSPLSAADFQAGSQGAGGDQPPIIGGGQAGGPGAPPAGGQGGPPGPAGGPPGGPQAGPQTWRDMGQGPNLDAAKGGTRDVFDSAVSAAGEQMIRAGKSADEINAYIGPKGFQPISQQAVAAAQAYLQAHPNFRGIFHATRTVPLAGIKGALNKFANSAPGAAVGSYINDVTGSHLDNIASAAGGDGQLVNLGLEAARQDHPMASLAGDIGAGASLYGLGRKVAGKVAGTAVGRIAAKLPNWTAPVAADAALGGYMGSGANGEQIFDPASAGTGALVAAGTGGLVRGAANAVTGLSGQAGSRIPLLDAQGVRASLGQRAGGLADASEKVSQIIPFVGAPIRSTRNIAIDQAQRGAFNTALLDIGDQLPQGTVKGVQAHAYLQQAFNKAYDNARAGMRFVPDKPYMQDLAQFRAQLANAELDGPQAAQVAQRIQNAVGSRLQASDGQLTGQAYSGAANDLASTARKWAKDPSKSSMADALNQYIDIMDNAAARNSPPEAVDALDAARRGYAKAVVIENAAKKGTGGEFTGRQLDLAAKETSPSVRRRAYLRGDAPMQDYAAQMAMLGHPSDASPEAKWLAGGAAGVGVLSHPLLAIPPGFSAATNLPGIRTILDSGLLPNGPAFAPARAYINGRKRIAGSLFGAAAAQSAVGGK